MSNPYAELKNRFPTFASEDEYRILEIHQKEMDMQQRPEVVADKILLDLIMNQIADWRFGVSIVVTPPQEIKKLIKFIQEAILRELKENESIWFAKEGFLHMTELEIGHSLPESEMNSLVDKIKESDSSRVLKKVLEFDVGLSLPVINFDKTGISITFTHTPHSQHSNIELRAFLYDTMKDHIVTGPRSVAPFHHITIARFIKELPTDTIIRISQVVKEINRTNISPGSPV